MMSANLCWYGSILIMNGTTFSVGLHTVRSREYV